MKIKAIKKYFLIFILLIIFSCSNEQSEQKLFSEPYRPQFHFTPVANWMNDPNGLVFYEGEYHLFFQYNPSGNKWGHMSWGHAISPDLVHWEHLPVAIPETDSIMIFSGSAVVDGLNTSGLGKNGISPLVAIFTGHHKSRKNQAQYIAYSNDKGRTWTMYKDNPVLDIHSADFRDPKVFWYSAEKKWIMIIALPDNHEVSFYQSENMEKWGHLSDFGPAGATGGVWECPDIYEIAVQGDSEEKYWVLEVDLAPGAIAGGSGGQYFFGEFNGKEFISKDKKIRWIDYGKDFYANVSFSNIPEKDGRRIIIGWMNNWEYAQDIPTSPWRSAQSLPRELTLREKDNEIILYQRPVEELKELRTDHKQLLNIDLTTEIPFKRINEISGRSMEIIAVFEAGKAEEFGLKVCMGENEETLVGYNTIAAEIFVDRSKSGKVQFNSEFPGRHSAPLKAADGKIKMHIFIDWSSIEVFANDGLRVITDRIFPSRDSNAIGVYTVGANTKLISLDVWRLKSIW